MRATFLIAASLAVIGLAACSKPAGKPAEALPDAIPEAVAAPPEPAPPQAGPTPGGPPVPGVPGARAPATQTLADMLDRARERFSAVDADHDGRVTPEEIQAAMQARGAGPPPGGGSGMMARADANNDGVITLPEWEARTRARFAKLDADHNGVVTRDEIRAAFAARQEAMTGGAQ